ncbi:MAG: hypothetical protein LBJ04_16230 [Sphingobacterium sp.]|jgi:uncharacterized protein (TIGR02145 family)|nr:hypothetical protein [Sphingobacterium sp.]
MKVKKILLWIPIVFIYFFMYACKKNSDQISMDKAVVRISVSGSQYGEVGNSASRASLTDGAAKPVQSQVIALDRDLVLRVELTAVNPGETTVSSTLTSAKKANIEQNVASGIKYKVAVFDNSGKYLTERDYTRGQESSTEELKLDVGVSYTFIAYSINSTGSNPSITFSDPANKTLSTASISGLNGTDDFMYFKKDTEISGTGDNNLSVNFSHAFSKIITKLDASSTNKNIAEIEATIDSHFPSADVQLSDASITRSGTAGEENLNFSGLNSPVATATNILNGNTTSGTLKISKLTIGTLTRTDIPAIGNLKILPGIQYNLNLTITDTDGTLVHLGQFSAKIGGLIWMQHNLGANTSENPDQSPTTNALLGDYYQFGYKQYVATANTPYGAIAGWNTTSAADGAWNSGTESAPVKTATDPCPSGFRVPSRAEYENLINSTTASNAGTWATSDGQNTTGAAKVLTSKTNPNVKLTFPAGGYRKAADGAMVWRGGAGVYWTLSATSASPVRFVFLNSSIGIGTTDGNQPYNIGTTSGYHIRCIAIQR